MIRIITIAFFLLLAAPVANAQTAEPPIGSILDVEGDGNLIMRASEEGKAYPAKLNDQIYRNDVLQTGPNADSRMLAVLIDESRFTFGTDSKFKVDEYAFDDNDDRANMARYNVPQGVFLYVSGLMTKKTNPDVKIATPYGSIGIRGTTVWGGQLGEQYGVFVDEGEVTLESKRGHIMIKSGQGTTLSGLNKVPERPRTLGDDIVSAARSTVSLGDADKIKERMESAKKKYPDMIALHKSYIDSARQQQLDNTGSVRRQGRGILKIEQDRQDEKMKGQNTETPTEMRDESPAQIPAPAPAEAPVDTGPKPDPKTEPAAPKKAADPL